MTLCALALLRLICLPCRSASVIAIKYGWFTHAEYARMDAQDLRTEEVLDKLMLAGWLRPSKRLLWREMDRAIARTSPHAHEQRIVFPDETSHVLALSDLQTYVGDVTTMAHVRAHERCVPHASC